MNDNEKWMKMNVDTVTLNQRNWKWNMKEMKRYEIKWNMRKIKMDEWKWKMNEI